MDVRRFICHHGIDTRTDECKHCASDRSERMTLISACMRYIDVGREVPVHLRVRLSDRDWAMVEDYRAHFIEDLDVRR